MVRTAISSDELLDWLNTELAKVDACQHCRFTSVSHAGEQDPEGCNWSPTNLRCSGTPASVCSHAADRTVEAARRRFNLH